MLPRRASANINDGVGASEPLGSDERGEEIDEHGGRHQDCHYGHRNALFKWIRRQTRTPGRFPSRRVRARTWQAARSRDSSRPILFPIRRRKWRHRNLPAVPCTTGPAELDKLEAPAGPWKRNFRREFRKRSISIGAVRHKGDIRARAIRSSASMAGHAAADRFSPRFFLAHNQRIVVDVNSCDELSPELGRIPSSAARTH
jgi:hypothetical protein